MAIILKKLFEKSNEYEAKIIAGEKGLNNIVNWFHVAESFEICEFIEEHSIIFTTGVGLNKDMDLFSLIQAHVNHHASGTIVNIGPFIHEVSEEIITYCNEENYPLFIVPWKVCLPKMMKLFSYLLLESEKAGIELGTALKNAISFPLKYKLYAGVFYQYGFEESDNYCMAIIEPKRDKKEIEKNTIIRMVKTIERVLMSSGDKSFIINSEGNFILLFSKYTDEAVKQIVRKILSALNSIWDIFYVGVGENVTKLSSISNSYMQALKIIKLNKKLNTKNKLVEYKGLGLYKILLCIEDKDVLEDYYDDMLGKLEEYDRKNKANYLKVLKLYLKKDGSINKTAKSLFLHRNTVNYKIRKIEHFLHCDLSNTEVRVRLYVAFCLKNIMNIASK